MIYITDPNIEGICYLGKIVSLESCQNCKYCKKLDKGGLRFDIINSTMYKSNYTKIKVDCSYEN